jgi:PAS domain S-box-containing protein
MKQPLSRQIQAMRQRMQLLYRSAHADTHQQELLPSAFDELDHALEELQTLETELYQQQAQLQETREHLEAERQTYQELFEHAPVSYLITSPEGTIRRANQAATTLFESIEKGMIGRSLALFVPEGERRAFRAAILQLHTMEGTQEWEAHMQPWGGPAFNAALSVAVVRGHLGRPLSLRWVIRELSQGNLTSERFKTDKREPYQVVHDGRAKEFGG